MSVKQLDTILEEFAAQRRYREDKRKLFLKRFQQIKGGFAPPSQLIQPRQQHLIEPAREPVPSVVPSHQVPKKVVNEPPPEENSVALNPEEERLIKQNQTLVETVGKLEEQINEQMKVFQQTLNTAKTNYVGQISKLVETSNQSKKQVEQKMKKLKTQTQAALIKNKEIEETNADIKKELENLGESGPDFEDIRKEYDEKLSSFEAIFNSSNEKIEALEKDFNEEQFVEGTVNNEQLLKSLEENAKKAEEASKILEDYKTLNEGKKEILNEIHNNNEMKEKEIAKMCELQQKMKMIMEKMNQEKQVVVGQNNRMAKELMEIKELLMASVGQAK